MIFVYLRKKIVHVFPLLYFRELATLPEIFLQFHIIGLSFPSSKLSQLLVYLEPILFPVCVYIFVMKKMFLIYVI